MCCLQYLILYGYVRMLTNLVTVVMAQREVSNTEVSRTIFTAHNACSQGVICPKKLASSHEGSERVVHNAGMQMHLSSMPTTAARMTITAWLSVFDLRCTGTASSHFIRGSHMHISTMLACLLLICAYMQGAYACSLLSTFAVVC